MSLSLLRQPASLTKSFARLLQVQKETSFQKIIQEINFLRAMTGHRREILSPTSIYVPFFHGLNCCGANKHLIKRMLEQTHEIPKLSIITNTFIEHEGSINDHLFLQTEDGHIIDVTWQQFLLISSGLENHEQSALNPYYSNFSAEIARLQHTNKFPWVFQDYEHLLETAKQVISMHPKVFPDPDYSYFHRAWGAHEQKKQTTDKTFQFIDFYKPIRTTDKIASVQPHSNSDRFF